MIKKGVWTVSTRICGLYYACIILASFSSSIGMESLKLSSMIRVLTQRQIHRGKKKKMCSIRIKKKKKSGPVLETKQAADCFRFGLRSLYSGICVATASRRRVPHWLEQQHVVVHRLSQVCVTLRNTYQRRSWVTSEHR